VPALFFAVYYAIAVGENGYQLTSEWVPWLVAAPVLIVASWLVFRWCGVRLAWLWVVAGVVASYLATLIPIPQLLAMVFGGSQSVAYFAFFGYAAVVGALVWWLIARFAPRRV
jgi:hypothetical protein